MFHDFTLAEFRKLYPNDDACLEEIKEIRYPDGVLCRECKTVTQHYKIAGRTAYGCRFCRNQIYPLTGTVFEKSTTPLTKWFYALFLMTQTRSRISIQGLQGELGVTYKTAWRMYGLIKRLMEQNEGDLLREPSALIKSQDKKTGDKIYKWVLFNAIEVRVVHRNESS